MAILTTPKRLYVAATSQHIGKTTSTLGLVQAFRNLGINVGYCKPVGQEGIHVEGAYADKDAVLFAKEMKFPLQASIHSPVILGTGATTRFLDSPESYDYEKDILHAAKILESVYEMVIYEGTGHPGVGAVVNLSNADVAHLLQAKVVLIVEGGIGNTIDRLKLSLSLFQARGVEVVGVIVNKVLPEKYDKVKYYVGKKLEEWNIPLLGVIHFDKTLLYPLFDTIRKAIMGRYLYNEHKLYNRVESIVAASLVDTIDFAQKHHILLVVSANRFNEVLHKIEEKVQEAACADYPISGIIITGDGRKEEWKQIFGCEHIINKHEIPVVGTELDTYGAAVQIGKIEVKINIHTPWKTIRAIELIEEHVDLQALYNSLH